MNSTAESDAAAAAGESEGETAERRNRRWRDGVIREYEEWMSRVTRAAGEVGMAFWMVEAMKRILVWMLPVMLGAVYPSTSPRNMAMIVGLCVLMFSSRQTVDGFLIKFLDVHSDRTTSTLDWPLRHHRTIDDPESQLRSASRLFPIPTTFLDPHHRRFLLTHLLLLVATISLSIPLYNYSHPSSNSLLPFIYAFASLGISFVALAFAHFLCAVFAISMAMRSPDESILVLFMSLLRSSHADKDGWSAALGHLLMNATPVRIFDFAYEEVLIPARGETEAHRPSFEEKAGAYREMLRYLYAHRNGESDLVRRIKTGNSDEREVGAWMVGFWVSSEMKGEVRSLRHDLLEELVEKSKQSMVAEGSVLAVLKNKPELMPRDLLRRIIMTRAEGGDRHVHRPAIVATAEEYYTKKKEEEEEKKDTII